MQENLSLGPRVRTAKTGAGRSVPLFKRLLESIISEFASSQILIFQLITVAEQAGLNLNKTSFAASRPIYFLLLYTAIHEHSHPLWKITKHYV